MFLTQTGLAKESPPAPPFWSVPADIEQRPREGLLSYQGRVWRPDSAAQKRRPLLLHRTATVLKVSRRFGINSSRGCVTPEVTCRVIQHSVAYTRRATWNYPNVPRTPHARQSLAALAETWTKLAAELESDQALLNALSEINFDEPFYAVPEALNLRAA